MQEHQSSRRPGLVISLVVLCVLVAGLWQRQAIFDWWRLREYQAPAAIAQLAADTTMTGKARNLFYVFHPQLDSKETFSQHCTETEATIVLGCYVTNRGIYLYDVKDPRLEGVKQVTAAHEMLHVAYQRLSAKERARVDALLWRAYDELADERIRANIDTYQKAGADVANELHSILGTEVASLPPELEAYYSQYFTNRAKIAAYSAMYESEFSSRQQKVAQYDAQLKAMEDQITTSKARLDAQDAALAVERQQLDAYLQSRNYQAYNNGVNAFNTSVRSYNELVNTTRALIDQYNSLVGERNQIAMEQRALTQSLDSRTQNQAGQ